MIAGQVLIIYTALVFLAIGFLLGRNYKEIKWLEKIPKEPKKVEPTKKIGIIDYPTQADIDYTESGEEAVDKERERIFKEQFKP